MCWFIVYIVHEQHLMTKDNIDLVHNFTCNKWGTTDLTLGTECVSRSHNVSNNTSHQISFELKWYKKKCYKLLQLSMYIIPYHTIPYHTTPHHTTPHHTTPHHTTSHHTIPQYRECTVGPLNWILCVRACRITHVISIIAASQLHFLANRNAELAVGSQ